MAGKLGSTFGGKYGGSQVPALSHGRSLGCKAVSVMLGATLRQTWVVLLHGGRVAETAILADGSMDVLQPGQTG
ncbi:MAG: hypothetical protein B7X82_08045 [Hydrogenophilales bacterium 17-64-65]|nr:MAG: hypothetical protein B7Y27_05235 [Hydrogenophilales bacterium 16-64-40]OZA33612.1 MAG: hypothetical protein B7X82_08045 [Hydrogenophilales bacterium 17-64-65]